MNPQLPKQDWLSLPDFQTLFESAPGLYLVLTPQLDIVAVTEAYLRATMTTRAQILGRGIFEVFPDNPDDPDATGVRNLKASLDRVLRDRRTDVMAVQKYDVRRPEESGGGFEERYWSPRNSPVLGPEGSVRYIIHRVEDVTEFVRLQKAGQEWKKQTAELEDRAAQMESEVYLRSQEVAETNRQLRSANEQLSRIYQQISLLMRRADKELSPETGQASEQDQLGPEEMLAKIGRLITSHKQLEEHLRQSQKMEAVGQLAGGIAHDFNNLLTVIIGHSLRLQKQLSESPVAASLKEIETAAQRAAALTSQLLAFSRKQILQPRIVSVNSVVTGMEDMLRRLIGEDVTVLTVLASSVGQVKVDPTQLEMILMNLAINARDAMPSGGRLTIETSNRHLGPGEIRTLEPGPYVTISVSDTGHGMDAATINRIFEPFFTTKGEGKGTGLGLSTSRGIAEQSGGILTAESTVGKGSTFRLYLPVATSVEPQIAAAQQQPSPRGPGTGWVLVVEDHPPLRELIETVLADAGYRVLVAASADEALHLAGENTVDLVLTDVVMPGLSGTALVQRMHAESQNLRVVFMSGHDRGMLQAQTSVAHFLQKPFTPKSLLGVVSQALGAPPLTNASRSDLAAGS